MSTYLYFTLIFGLLMIHAVWMALFALEVFFETSRQVASERARTLAKYIVFGIALEFCLGGAIWLFVKSLGA